MALGLVVLQLEFPKEHLFWVIFLSATVKYSESSSKQSSWNFSLNIMEVGCHHACQEGCERPEVSHAASTAPCSRGTNPCLVSQCLYKLGDCSFPLWNVRWGAGSLWELQRQWWPCCQFPLRSAWLRRLLMSRIWAEAWSRESFVDGPYKSCNMKWLMWLIWFIGVGGGMEPAEYRFYI